LLEQDHRQQAGAGPTPGNDMERRRSLADLLAIAAGELLTDVLDYLPLPRDYLQSLGDVLAQFAPPRATAAPANRRSRLDPPLGLDPGRPGRFLDALCALRDQRRPQRGDIVGEILGRSRHGPDYPTPPRPQRSSTQG